MSHQHDHKDKGHGGHNHGWMMVVCLVMMIGFLLLPNVGGRYTWVIFLLCPLMHIFMMKDMFKNKEKQDDQKS